MTRSVDAVRAVVVDGADRIGAQAGTPKVDSALAALIDHTLLKPDATEVNMRKPSER